MIHKQEPTIRSSIVVSIDACGKTRKLKFLCSMNLILWIFTALSFNGLINAINYIINDRHYNYDAAIRIAESCYSPDMTISIMSSSKHSHLLIPIMTRHLHWFPKIILDHPDKTFPTSPNKISTRQTKNLVILDEFKLDARGTQQFYEPSDLESSHWYNTATHFIVVMHEATYNQNLCNNRTARAIQQTLKKHFDECPTRPNTVFICMNRNKQINIYSLDQFTNGAERYVMEQTYNTNLTCQSVFLQRKPLIQPNKRRIHILVRSFSKLFWLSSTQNTSKSINKISNHCKQSFDIESSSQWQSDVHGFHGLVLKTIFLIINASAHITFCSASDQVAKRFDISLNRDISHLFTEYPPSYQILQQDIVIVTSERTKIVETSFKSKMIIAVVVISIILVYAYGVLSKLGTVRPSLNALRFSLGIRLKIPHRITARIFFGCLILPHLIFMINFRSYQFYEWTVEPAIENLESIADLQYLGYKIYARDGYDYLLRLVNNTGCHKENYVENCVNLVLNDSHAACIDDSEYLKSNTEKNMKLHVIKERIEVIPISYPVRTNWDLRPRVNTLLSRLHESGLTNLWWKQHVQNISKSVVNQKSIYKSNPIALKQCENYFFILIVGFTISLFVFILEIHPIIVSKIKSLGNL